MKYAVKAAHVTVSLMMRIATMFFIATCFASPLISAENVSPNGRDQTEILSLVLKAEMQANGWTKSEVICFSFEGTDPNVDLIKALRQRHLNVSKENFACGFQVYVGYTKFDSTQTTVHSYVLDLREAKKGKSDLALLRRDGEYFLTKTAGKWSIRDYVPKKLVASTVTLDKSPCQTKCQHSILGALSASNQETEIPRAAVLTRRIVLLDLPHDLLRFADRIE
jgi:hypothetical protein